MYKMKMSGVGAEMPFLGYLLPAPRKRIFPVHMWFDGVGNNPAVLVEILVVDFCDVYCWNKLNLSNFALLC